MELGCQMTEVALLGTIALRTLVPDQQRLGWPAKILQWDAATMRITNDDAANDCVSPPYREGWSI
jgi:hypothetical protein